MNVIKGDGILTKKIRTNPNGNLTELELLKLVHSGDIDNYLRNHKLASGGGKCPPYNLISNNQQCCYCTQCFRYCIDQIKIYKDHYKIGKEKFTKEELDDKG